MAYNPVTDFLALWRNNAGTVSKLTMPGLDFVVSALARAGAINLVASATAPVANQATTAWLQEAVPSYSAEGVLQLWNAATTSYAPATPALFFGLLQAAAGQNGVSWYTTTGGPPSNLVGNNGDFAIRLDAPNGVYGPKTLGVWPAVPVPGTADVITSMSLDNTFGAAEGAMLYRGAAVWAALPIGASNSLLVAGTDPAWESLSALMDVVFGNAQGSILYRDAGLWNDLPPGNAGQILSTAGPGANPAWVARTAEFPPGTVMLFQQSAAPPGWTKQTALNDCGLRVTSGPVTSVAGSAFSTVFAQTTVGNTILTLAQIPAHSHDLADGFAIKGPNGPQIANGAGVYTLGNNHTVSQGGGGAHNHSINLSLAYVDVIIASKN